MSQGFPGSNPYENPYEDPRRPSGFGELGRQPPKKSGWSSSAIILIVLGVVGGGGILLCFGGGIAVVMLGMDVSEAEVTAQLRDHPLIRDSLGEIQKCETNFAKSVAELLAELD